ncbi:MAG: hypothetical protein AB8H79_02720 [Myxococcota bacterium]
MTALAADTDGVVSAGLDFTLVVRGPDLTPRATLPGPSSRHATTIALSATQVSAFFAPPNPSVGLWNRQTHAGVSVGRGHRGFGTGLSFAPGGSLVSSDSNGQIQVWTKNLQQSMLIQGRAKGFENFVRAVQAHDQSLLYANRMRQIRRIDLASRKTTHLFMNRQGSGDQVLVAEVGEHVCVVDSFGGITVFSSSDRTVIDSMNVAEVPWSAVAASSTFAHVFLTSKKSSVIVETPFAHRASHRP